MDKKILAIIIVIVLAIGGGIAFLAASSSDEAAKQDMIEQDAITAVEEPTADSGVDQEPVANPDQPVSGPIIGAYVDYRDNIVAQTEGTKILFFHAPWCPQCRALDVDINKQGVPSGVTIIKVDYDSNQSLRQKYGVTIQTTLVRVDDQGNLVKKFVAYDEPTLAAVKRNLL